MEQESLSSKIDETGMTDKDGRKTNLRGTKENDRLLPDPNSDRPTGCDGRSDGTSQPERSDRTVCEGAVISRAARPRPATHGKTLTHLIRSVQSRMGRNARKIAQLEQEITDLREENEFEAVELDRLTKALEAWNERVASLKVLSTESEVEQFDPAEELTA